MEVFLFRKDLAKKKKKKLKDIYIRLNVRVVWVNFYP